MVNRQYNPHDATITNAHRRQFITMLGTVGALGVAGCLGDAEDADDSRDDPDDTGDEDDDTQADDSEKYTKFAVAGIEPSQITVEQGEYISVGATVANIGENEGVQDVSFQIDGDVLETQAVTLAPAEDEWVSFEEVVTGDIDPGEYTHAVVTADDESAGTITITAPPELDKPAFAFHDALLVPGEQQLRADWENPYDFAIHDGEVELTIPDDWELTDSSGTTFTELAPFSSQSIEWTVETPDDGVDAQELTATVGYRRGSREATFTVAHTFEALTDPAEYSLVDDYEGDDPLSGYRNSDGWEIAGLDALVDDDQAAPVLAGNHSLTVQSGNSNRLRFAENFAGLEAQPAKGTIFSVLYQGESDDQARFFFGVEDNDNYNYLDFGPRDDNLIIGKRSGGGTNTIEEAENIGLAPDEPVEFVVEWHDGAGDETDNEIIATVYEYDIENAERGDEIASLSANDDEFEDAVGTGFRSIGDGSPRSVFDECRVLADIGGQEDIRIVDDFEREDALADYQNTGSWAISGVEISEDTYILEGAQSLTVASGSSSRLQFDDHFEGLASQPHRGVAYSVLYLGEANDQARIHFGIADEDNYNYLDFGPRDQNLIIGKRSGGSTNTIAETSASFDELTVYDLEVIWHQTSDELVARAYEFDRDAMRRTGLLASVSANDDEFADEVGAGFRSIGQAGTRSVFDYGRTYDIA